MAKKKKQAIAAVLWPSVYLLEKRKVQSRKGESRQDVIGVKQTACLE